MPAQRKVNYHPPVQTGRSLGCGCVEMPNVTEAQAAIEGLQGATLEGRPLTVTEAY